MTAKSDEVSKTAPRAKGRNVLAIASGKGGVGKTWFAITLTHSLVREGKKALLFDGDLGLANIDIQLGLMPKHDLGGVISGRIGLRDAVTPFPDGGFDIIAGRSGSGSLANLPVTRLQALSDDLIQTGKSYDKVLIDLGAGVDQGVRQMTSLANTVIVITNGDPTSLTDAYAFIKVTHMARPKTDIRVVVNMAKDRKEGEAIYNKLLKACEGFLKISPPLLGVVRADPRVSECIRSQTPLLMRHPNCDAAHDMEAITQKLLEG
ncbi:flagellar biosynthesis protein FlhG [Thalassospira sp. MBR-102]|jgi:flagellar biosynthesis protein FlhG|uniref:Cobyrinic acid a,c-diamide synthase n=3 Tax=Thalassospira TaxID=168934 RepID=A0ABR5Y1U1_9PROT|nr:MULTISPECIES: MinD/ParA family protein [Thalassospira]MBR9778512.1 MinD/ParA family protein [Rhodospirillales bacterium]KEO57258.1 cobyrinic acid a,c-diamide synthase [Thalassospira permensis NBRC 106175]KZD03771.1 cobyrinic acid a,c-diamide synthase [Thalassospira xiamenensis]KZD05890.1 cobyrinic acid a,c-diamide synthase [Thalassospira xiamenensis]MAB35058.1 MinD/ParA family protein [Thalassospira sp.]|tara:strand:+ start:3898 stop:4686 length:789 start_codon:yes stop_codon:yes gene_type:complete